ncbi:MAG: NFACT family protein [Pseudomonadota bacterium]
MDLPILQCIANELNQALAGGFINKIHQPLPREILLRARVPGMPEQKVVICADPQRGRLHLTTLRIPNPPSPPRFCAYLRAHFQGGRITGVKCTENDRVVRISAERNTEGGKERRDLVLELLGRDSNIILVDAATNRIMECLHRIPYKETATRIVEPGREYAPPPMRTGPYNPDRGLNSSEGRPGITLTPAGRPKLTLSAAPSTDRLFPSLNSAADAMYGEQCGGDMLEAYRRVAAAPLKKRIRSLERRLAKIEADRRTLGSLADRQYEGELLKANLHQVKKGMLQVEVDDWATGLKRTIRLEPAADAIRNMELIFKKAAKGKRGLKMTEGRYELTLQEKGSLEDMLFFVDRAADILELDLAVQDLPEGLGAPSKASPKPSSIKEKSVRQWFRHFRTPGGRSVFVGRSGAGNDRLLRRKARDGDLWLHVKDMAGAHVILLVRDAEPVSPEDTAFAASLAVSFSRAAAAGKAEVMIADVKDVHHPKGAGPGRVNVVRYRAVTAKPADLNGEEFVEIGGTT